MSKFVQLYFPFALLCTGFYVEMMCKRWHNEKYEMHCASLVAEMCDICYCVALISVPWNVTIRLRRMQIE